MEGDPLDDFAIIETFSMFAHFFLLMHPTLKFRSPAYGLPVVFNNIIAVKS